MLKLTAFTSRNLDFLEQDAFKACIQSEHQNTIHVVKVGYLVEDGYGETILHHTDVHVTINPGSVSSLRIPFKISPFLRRSSTFRPFITYDSKGGKATQLLTHAHLIVEKKREPDTSFFISYKMGADGELATMLQYGLENAGFDVNIAPVGVPGAKLSDAIRSSIDRSSALILLWTEHSVSSKPIDDEIRYARSNQKRIMPIVTTFDGLDQSLRETDCQEITRENPRSGMTTFIQNIDKLYEKGEFRISG